MDRLQQVYQEEDTTLSRVLDRSAPQGQVAVATGAAEGQKLAVLLRAGDSCGTAGM